MGFGSGAELLKFILIGFNLLFWIGGAAALGVGIWLAVDEDAFDTLDIINPEGMDYTVWKVTVYKMIAAGAFIFLVASFGMMGACCENRCMLMTYSILSGTVCVILAVVYKDDSNEGVQLEMFNDLVNKYTTVDDDENSYVATWNNFQSKMKCCGSYNFTDWHLNKNYGPANPEPVPWTCCRMHNVTNPPEEEDVVNMTACYDEGSQIDAGLQPTFSYLHTVSCYEALAEWIDYQSIIIYGVTFGVTGVQIFGIVFACILYRKI